jgi:hypothetical protein
MVLVGRQKQTVKGGEDYARMTPQQEKNMPKTGAFDGNTA